MQRALEIMYDAVILPGQPTWSLILAALFSVGCSYTVSRFFKPNRIEYPPLAPGGMIQHVKMMTSAHCPWWLLGVAKELNSRVFRLSLPGSPLRCRCVVGEPSTFRAILTDPLSTKPMKVYGRLKNMNGNGIAAMFTSNGSLWHSKRKAVSPAFSSNQVKRMNMLAIQKVESWIQERLSVADTEDVRFDVATEMIDVILSAICETAFDYKMPRWERNYLCIELEHALVEFARKGANIFRARFSWFVPSRQRALQAGKNLHRLCLKIIDAYKKKDNKAKGTIIQLIMESDEAFPTYDDKAAQLLEFLVAGFDTVGYTISWILISLAENKDEQSKLRKSLQQLNSDTWNNSQELEWAIKEGMRLNPVASSGSVRTVGRDIITHDGCTIPKGSICILSFILLFRNPEVFPEPDSFIPSRWKDPTREQLDAFQPFSMGKQNCVGQSLARAEITSIIARIISEFELSVDEPSSITSEFFLTLKPVNAILTARKV